MDADHVAQMNILVKTIESGGAAGDHQLHPGGAYQFAQMFGPGGFEALIDQ